MVPHLLGTWLLTPSYQPPALALRLGVGLLLSGPIAWAAYRRYSLSRSGACGAVVVGALIFCLGGWPWGLLLVAFFVSSSVLSHYRAGQKQAVADHYAKTGCRDLGQVLANGGLGVLLAAWHAATGGSQPLFFFAFAGAMAAVNADTWATELGVLSRVPPRLITSGECVPAGSSGAVSWLGIAAALAGAWFIGFLGLAFQVLQGAVAGAPVSGRLVWLPLVASLGGLIGSLCDSLLGATLQATYYCSYCGKETEQPTHRCGHQAIHMRGWHWFDNDWVNLLASLAGALVAAFLGSLALYLR